MRNDLDNAISVAHLIPVGGEDIDHVQGGMRLVRATGDEDFLTVAGVEAAATELAQLLASSAPMPVSPCTRPTPNDDLAAQDLAVLDGPVGQRETERGE